MPSRRNAEEPTDDLDDLLILLRPVAELRRALDQRGRRRRRRRRCASVRARVPDVRQLLRSGGLEPPSSFFALLLRRAAFGELSLLFARPRPSVSSSAPRAATRRRDLGRIGGIHVVGIRRCRRAQWQPSIRRYFPADPSRRAHPGRSFSSLTGGTIALGVAFASKARVRRPQTKVSQAFGGGGGISAAPGDEPDGPDSRPDRRARGRALARRSWANLEHMKQGRRPQRPRTWLPDANRRSSPKSSHGPSLAERTSKR